MQTLKFCVTVEYMTKDIVRVCDYVMDSWTNKWITETGTWLCNLLVGTSSQLWERDPVPFLSVSFTLESPGDRETQQADPTQV